MKQILLMIGMVALVGCGKKLPGGSSPPAERWVTYQNSKLGFKIRFPSDPKEVRETRDLDVLGKATFYSFTSDADWGKVRYGMMVQNFSQNAIQKPDQFALEVGLRRWEAQLT